MPLILARAASSTGRGRRSGAPLGAGHLCEAMTKEASEAERS